VKWMHKEKDRLIAADVDVDSDVVRRAVTGSDSADSEQLDQKSQSTSVVDTAVAVDVAA